MKISDFSGGLSTRLDPTLINQNEATLFTNVDNAKGNLTSIKDFSQLVPEQSIERWFYKFKNKWYSSVNDREYLEYQDKLYFTEKANRPSKIVNDVQKLVGIDAPTQKLTTVVNPVGSLSGPSMILPPGNAKDVAISPGGDHAVVTSDTAPYITIYKIELGRLVKIDDPASLPAGTVTGAAYSTSGAYLAISITASPYVIIYKRSGDVYTKLTDPVALPAGTSNGVAWSSDETYLTVAHAVSPYITIYKRAGDVFTKLANPASLPAGVGNAVVFSSDTTYMAVAHVTTPFVTIYKRAADVFTKLANPASLPAGDGLSIDFSLDGTYLTIGLTTSPYLATYSRAVDVFTKLPDFANAPAGPANGVAFSNNYNYLAVAHNTTPFVTYYKRLGSTFTKLSNPGIVPAGNAIGLAWTPDDLYVAVAHTTTPFISVYKRTNDVFSQYNAPTVLQYVYTYYDSTEGVESAPSPISDELTITDGTSVDLSGFITSSNESVDKIRLYRVGANATDFTLIVELTASTTTYNDNIPTVNAIGTLLDTYNNQAPLSGLRYLIEAYGMLFAALGNKLYYTIPGQPDYWPSLNFIQFPNDITGIVAIADGIIVFTLKEAHIVTGTGSDTFRRIIFNPEHGCINHNSIKYVKNTLLWASADGICALNGNTVIVITKDKLDRITFDLISAASFNEQYYLILNDGTVFILDVRFNPCFKNYEYLENQVYNLGVFDNILYGVVTGKLVTIDTGTYIDFYYESPCYTEGEATNRKLYNVVYVNANGRFIFDTYIDGVQVSSQELIGKDTFEVKIPQELQAGYDIQFKIQGSGVIREIEYKVQGRDNGR